MRLTYQNIRFGTLTAYSVAEVSCGSEQVSTQDSQDLNPMIGSYDILILVIDLFFRNLAAPIFPSSFSKFTRR